VPAHEKAAEMAPDNPTILLDLAMSLVRWRRDAARAREFWEQAKTHALSDTLETFARMIEGMIAVESGEAENARNCLEQSIEELKPLRHATPLIGAGIDRAYAYLAIACAESGELAAAKKYYRRCKPRLRALGSNDLLNRCEAALGLKPTKETAA
ncbi:MAG: hypothetical protein KY475_21645, partial [Planctomycetes bacterium]|nr:hypothetical protein [Planctomycetota bacterium]